MSTPQISVLRHGTEVRLDTDLNRTTLSGSPLTPESPRRLTMSSSPSTTLSRLRAKRAAEDRGFTLIELLVVVVIIGVLVGIAVPVYLNYRKGAQDKSAQSDVRAGISAVEQFYNTNNAYPTDVANAQAATTATPPGSAWSASPGNLLGFAASGGTSYRLCAQSAAGNTFFYDSSVGGSVKQSTAGTFSATCVGLT